MGLTREPTGAGVRASRGAGHRGGALGGRGSKETQGCGPRNGTGVHLTAASARALKPQAARCILARLCGKRVQGTPPITALKVPILGVQLGKTTLDGRWVDVKQQHPP